MVRAAHSSAMGAGAPIGVRRAAACTRPAAHVHDTLLPLCGFAQHQALMACVSWLQIITLEDILEVS